MNVIKWLKLEFYIPQRNKALKKVAYYKWSVDMKKRLDKEKNLVEKTKGDLDIMDIC